MAARGAGAQIERVAWDKKVEGSDTYGNPIPGSFTEQFQSRAGFLFLQGGEAVIAARLEGRQPVRVQVYATSRTRQIRNGWRMRDLNTDVEYAVRAVAPQPDRRWLIITVESGVAA